MESQTSRIECGAAPDPAVRALIVAGLLVAFGVWCAVEVAGGKYPYAPLTMQDPGKFLGWAMNYFGQFVFPAGALVFIVWTVMYMRRRLVADEKGIGFVGGQTIAWNDVQQVDATLLKSKDILVVKSSAAELKLRGWHLKNFKDLVVMIDARVPKERVVRV